MSSLSPSVLGIDVVSDVVCPWCYVGKRQLEQALARRHAMFPDLPPPVVRWRPFQLNPGLPPAGMPRQAYLERKFGAADGGGRYDRVLAAAREVGLELRLDAIRVQPNTLKAHGLIELAAESLDQSAAAEAFFRAYFQEGRDLSDDAVLREVALGAGMSEALVDTVLGSDSVTQIVAAADTELREYGVTGVPLFIIGNALGEHVAVSGAQGSAALLEAMRKAQEA
jgi:predicted DsbA family dithiol-disulfide isomerase